MKMIAMDPRRKDLQMKRIRIKIPLTMTRVATDGARVHGHNGKREGLGAETREETSGEAHGLGLPQDDPKGLVPRLDVIATILEERLRMQVTVSSSWAAGRPSRSSGRPVTQQG